MSPANTTISFWGVQLTNETLHSKISPFPHLVSLSEERIPFSKQSPKTIFSTNTLSLCLSTVTTLPTHFSATNIPTPPVFALLPIQNSLYLLPIAPKSLHPLPLHRVSWTHATSIFLSANTSTSSPALPVSEPVFEVPTRKLQPSLSAVYQP